MARVALKRGESTYTFELDLDADAFARGDAIQFSLSASVSHPDGLEQSVALTVAVSRDEEGGLILSAAMGDVVFRIAVRDLVDSTSAVGAVIESLPLGVVDPVIGCAIRGGLSAVVDEVIACRDAVERTGWREQAWAVLGCLRGKAGDIGLKAAARFLKCVAGDYIDL